MSKETEKLNEAHQRYKELKGTAKSLIMATVGENDLPNASYAPFVYHAGGFYIYVSRLSAHTQELIANPTVSILLIEDESEASQIFARTRLSGLCRAEIIDCEVAAFAEILKLFKQRFGTVIDLLQSLPDFVLFRLDAISGRFVTGFGQAYDLVGEHLDRLSPIGPERINRDDPGAESDT